LTWWGRERRKKCEKKIAHFDFQLSFRERKKTAVRERLLTGAPIRGKRKKGATIMAIHHVVRKIKEGGRDK